MQHPNPTASKESTYPHTHSQTARASLADSGANLCMTNNPNLLVDVHPCAPFTIAVATSNGQHSQSNVCCRRSLLPLLLLDGSFHYQTCYINPHASDTFISPQAISTPATAHATSGKWKATQMVDWVYSLSIPSLAY